MSIKAIFSPGQTEITVNGLYQWDYGQSVEIILPGFNGVYQVHIACAGMPEAVVRTCSVVNDVLTVPIPDQALEQTAPITAWIYKAGESSGGTVATVKFTVSPRTKPAASPTLPPELSDRYTEALDAMNEVVDALGRGEIEVGIAKGAPSTGKNQMEEDDGGKAFTFANTHGFGVSGIKGTWKVWGENDGADSDHTGDGELYSWLVPSHSERMSIGRPQRLVKRLYAKLLGAADYRIQNAYLKKANISETLTVGGLKTTEGSDVLSSVRASETFRSAFKNEFENLSTVYEGGGPLTVAPIIYEDGAFGLYQAEVVATAGSLVEVYDLGQFRINRGMARTTILPFVPNGLQMYKIQIQHDGSSNSFTVSASYHPFCNEKVDQEYNKIQVRFRRILQF